MNMEEQLYLENVKEEDLGGFRLIRSHSDNRKFNVVAVNTKGEILVTVYADMEAEEAIKLVDTLNYPYEQDPQMTELVEVQEGKKTRFYYAAK